MTPNKLNKLRAVAHELRSPWLQVILAAGELLDVLSHIDAQAEQIESLESCLVTMNRCIADGVRGFVTKEEQGACYDLLEQAQARADALLANRPDPMRAELARLNELAGDAGACRLKAEMAERHASQLRERLAKAELEKRALIEACNTQTDRLEKAKAALVVMRGWYSKAVIGPPFTPPASRHARTPSNT